MIFPISGVYILKIQAYFQCYVLLGIMTIGDSQGVASFGDMINAKNYPISGVSQELSEMDFLEIG